jgi:uncharacterized protein with HEPN domain
MQHMLDAAREVIKSAAGRERGDLEKDYVWTMGVVKCVEIIGEAAAHVGKETKEAHPEIPWLQIVAMRNRLVHVYFDIDLDEVWKAVTDDLPPLIMKMGKILEAEAGN